MELTWSLEDFSTEDYIMNSQMSLLALKLTTYKCTDQLISHICCKFHQNSIHSTIFSKTRKSSFAFVFNPIKIFVMTVTTFFPYGMNFVFNFWNIGFWHTIFEPKLFWDRFENHVPICAEMDSSLMDPIISLKRNLWWNFLQSKFQS